MKVIAVINQSSKIGSLDLKKVVEAVQIQISQDFNPIWAKNATLVITEKFTNQDYYVLIKDNISVKGLEGYHSLDENNVPFAEMKYSKDWSFTFSHEVLEMIHNPYIKEIEQTDLYQNIMEEVADATATEGYKINGVKVSNFVTPDFYNIKHIDGLKYDFMGLLKRPLELYEGGYMSWFDANNQYYQAIKTKGKLIIKKLTGQETKVNIEYNPIFWAIIVFFGIVTIILKRK